GDDRRVVEREAVLALGEAGQRPARAHIPGLLVDLRQIRLARLPQAEQDRLEPGVRLDELRLAGAEQVAEPALARERDRVRVAALRPEQSKLETNTCGLPVPSRSAAPTEYMSLGSRMYRLGSTPSRAKSSCGSLTSTGQPDRRSPFGFHA